MDVRGRTRGQYNHNIRWKCGNVEMWLRSIGNRKVSISF